MGEPVLQDVLDRVDQLHDKQWVLIRGLNSDTSTPLTELWVLPEHLAEAMVTLGSWGDSEDGLVYVRMHANWSAGLRYGEILLRLYPKATMKNIASSYGRVYVPLDPPDYVPLDAPTEIKDQELRSWAATLYKRRWEAKAEYKRNLWKIFGGDPVRRIPPPEIPELTMIIDYVRRLLDPIAQRRREEIAVLAEKQEAHEKLYRRRFWAKDASKKAAEDEAAAVAGVRKSSVTGAVTPFCHRCGVEIGDPEARYCWSCGAHQERGDG